MRKCPFCAEEIQDEAVKCQFCNEYLEDNIRKVAGLKPKWYSKTSTLIIGFLIIGPLIIPAVWFNPHYSNAKKVILSVIIVLVSFFLFQMVKTSFDPISQYYQMIEGHH